MNFGGAWSVVRPPRSTGRSPGRDTGRGEAQTERPKSRKTPPKHLEDATDVTPSRQGCSQALGVSSVTQYGIFPPKPTVHSPFLLLGSSSMNPPGSHIEKEEAPTSWPGFPLYPSTNSLLLLHQPGSSFSHRAVSKSQKLPQKGAESRVQQEVGWNRWTQTVPQFPHSLSLPPCRDLPPHPKGSF